MSTGPDMPEHLQYDRSRKVVKVLRSLLACCAAADNLLSEYACLGYHELKHPAPCDPAVTEVLLAPIVLLIKMSRS